MNRTLRPRRRGARLAYLPFAALLAACGTNPIGVPSRPCVGSACDTDADSGVDGSGDLSVPDFAGDAPADDADLDAQVAETGDEADAQDCLGAPNNACGGCLPLEAEPGDPCGPCGDGEWVCLDPDEVGCTGATATLRDWWVDRDGDGHGDPDIASVRACGPPDEHFADNADDCDDDDPGTHPGAAEVCDGVDNDCDDVADEAPDDRPDCTDPCCDPELVCEGGQCLIPCDTLRCGASLELCCDEGDLCYADACATPGEMCVYTEDCAVDEICEPSLGLCLPRDVVPACEYVPEIGVFSPRLGCRWTTAGLTVNTGRDDVVATPVVINLTDDNGDGLTDRNDIPDIAFLTYNYESNGCCNVHATLRIVSGRCNDDATADTPATMVTLASINTPTLNNDTGMAAGDLDGDGVPEIVALGFWGGSGDDHPGGTVAFRRLTDDGTSWEEYWRNETYPTWESHTRGGATFSIADLNHDGHPEVVIGNVVLNGQTGALLWDGLDSAADGETVGIGNNAFLGPVSAVADVDGDGFQEVIAGNTLYSWDGDVIASFDFQTDGVTAPNRDCDARALGCDGFDAVANFDDDDEAEIVIIRQGQIFVVEHDMTTLLWWVDVPVDDCNYNEGGPPTIADFDGDGFPEIGTAAADFYVVADMECDPPLGEVPDYCDSRGIRWAVPNHDCSSRVTASSVFDFEGDGAAEVVYADEANFRIFDGATGAILYDDPTHGSHTRIEMPVIADVNNDGNAEIVIPENGYNNGRPGLDIWVDTADNWVRTRRVWNQHGYHVTNVTEDGAVPAVEEANWLADRLNNYRQNVQPAGLFDAPDLALANLDVDSADCEFEVVVTVANEGALAVPDGMLVRVELLDGGEAVDTEEARTLTRLFPGDSETLSFVLVPPEDSETSTFVVRAAVDPDEMVNECDELDNAVDREADLSCAPKP